MRGNGEVPEDHAGTSSAAKGFAGPEKTPKNAETEEVRLVLNAFLTYHPSVDSVSFAD